MKTLKFALLTLSTLLLILMVTLSLILVQPNWFKQPLSQLVEQQTGLQLSIARLDSGIQPASFIVQQIELRNATGKSLFNAQKIAFELRDWPTLNAPFFTLAVSAPYIYYQLDANGNSNWPAEKSTTKTSENLGDFLLPGDFSFHRITVENGLLEIDLPAQKRKIALPTLQLMRGAEDNAKLKLVTEIDGERFELEGDFKLVSESLLGIELALINPSVESLLNASLSTRAQLNGSDGQMELSLHNTGFLSRLLGMQIPKIPSATFSANFSIGEHYRLSNLLLSLGKQSLRGDADYSPLDNHLSLALKTERLALDELLAVLKDFSNKPEITTAANHREMDIDWSALAGIELDADISIGEFSGFGWTGEALTAHTALRNKGNKAPKLAIAAAGKKIRNPEQGIDLQSLSLEVDLAALALETQGADANIFAKIHLNKQITFSARGRANLNGVAAQSLQLDFQAPESIKLWQLAGLPYAEAGALSIKGAFESEKSTLKPDLAIALGEQQVDIEIAYTPAATASERTFLSITANGRNLDARFLTPLETSTQAEDSSKPPPAEQAQKSPLFSKEVIDTEFLRSFDAELSVDIKKLVTAINTIDQISFIGQLKDGRLTSRESRLLLPDNDLTLSLAGDFRKDTSTAQIEFVLDTKNAGKLGLEKAAKIQGGHGNIKVNLRGQGLSPHDIASTL
ncbi:MAG: hypothetical protein ACI89D_002542, partial [Bermanella sp.]